MFTRLYSYLYCELWICIFPPPLLTTTCNRMERERAFNFKLLVPPRVSFGQVSAVRPQEAVEKCGEFMDTLQQVRSIYTDLDESSKGNVMLAHV